MPDVSTLQEYQCFIWSKVERWVWRQFLIISSPALVFGLVLGVFNPVAGCLLGIVIVAISATATGSMLKMYRRGFLPPLEAEFRLESQDQEFVLQWDIARTSIYWSDILAVRHFHLERGDYFTPQWIVETVELQCTSGPVRIPWHLVEGTPLGARLKELPVPNVVVAVQAPSWWAFGAE